MYRALHAACSMLTAYSMLTACSMLTAFSIPTACSMPTARSMLTACCMLHAHSCSKCSGTACGTYSTLIAYIAHLRMYIEPEDVRSVSLT